jgi:hypothetical protein
MDSLDIQIREAVLGFISGKTDLQSFEDWFVPATWDIEKSGSPAQTFELAHEIELLLAEYTNGHRSESNLKEELSRVIPVYRAEFRSASTSVTSATSQITQSEELPFRWTDDTVILGERS